MALPFAGKYVKVVEALGNAKSHKAVARELGAELITGPVEFPEQTFVIFSEHGLYKRNEVVLPPQPDAHEQLLYITSVFLYNCKRAKQLLPLDPEYLCFQAPVFGNAIAPQVPEQEQTPASPVAEQEPAPQEEEEEEEVEVVEPPKRKWVQHAPKPNPKKAKRKGRMQAVLNDSSSDDLSSSSSDEEEEEKAVVVKAPKYTSPPDSSSDEDEDEDLRRAKAAYEALLAKKGKPAAAAAAASPTLDVGAWKTHEQQSLRKFFEENNHLSTYMLAKQAAETRVVNRSAKSIEPRIVQLRMTLQPEYVAGKHHATAEADNVMMRWAYLWNEEHPEDLCYGKRAWEALLDTGKVKDRTVISLKKRWDHVVRTKFDSAPDEAFQAGKDLGETDVDAWWEGRA